jgi:uncharacterized protein YjgD (DUF1641 family)
LPISFTKRVKDLLGESMASPIPLNIPPDDPREALYRRLEKAPKEHAAALLDAFDILQGLRDKGLLEIAKGALGSGEQILEIIVEASNSPATIRGIRNFIILTRLFATLDPEFLEHVAVTVPKVLHEAKSEKPLGRASLLGKLSNRDTRRMLSIMTKVLERLGKDLNAKAGH